MFVTKNLSFPALFRFTGHHVIWLTCWASLTVLIYHWAGDRWVSIPWLPISVIGTAVAFYVGFKNNSAYDRLWEARKIWGGIVNSSRSWGAAVRAFVTDHHAEVTEAELQHAHKRLVHRHIAWLYVLRAQLLVPTGWEHISQRFFIARHARRVQQEYGLGTVEDKVTERVVERYLQAEELKRLAAQKNIATQLVDWQAQDLKELSKRRLVDDFRHVELQRILQDFYTLQGQCERIKKFPLPRQYAGMSFIFVGIFIFLLPLGMVSEFDKLGPWGALLSIPFTVIVGWVYVSMEIVGDYSENPFEGLGNDIPMLSLCRTIEIDLLQMTGETELPPPIESKHGVLM